MSEWISVEDQLPEIDFSRSKCWWRVCVIATDGKSVKELRYVSNGHAKTEKGRKPRFEDSTGRIAIMKPTHWMPLPEPPHNP